MSANQMKPVLMSRNIKISPSILSADFSRLGDEVRALCDAGADYIHVDVMDGQFVPNITIGPQVVESIKRCSGSVPLDVHLMIVEPARYVRDFANAGTDMLTVHVECEGRYGCDEALALISTVMNARMNDMMSAAMSKVGAGIKRGISLSPRTSVDAINRFISEVDLVLVMTVEPGFAGQGFMDDQLPKIRHVASKAAELGRKNLLIAVDGGISEKTAGLCLEAGANMLIAGSYVLGGRADNKPSVDCYRKKMLQLLG